MIRALTINKLLDISHNPPKRICIFCAGELGKTVAYDFITMAGLNIDFYCDNYVPVGTIIRGGIGIEPLSKITQADKDIVVFIAASSKYQEEIYPQVEKLTSGEIYGIDNDFYCHAMGEIDLMNDEVKRLFWSFYDDKTYLKSYYEKRTGEILDFDNPSTFNEKLQWLKLNDRKSLYTKLADKIEVKKYVEEIVGKGHVIPTLNTYNSVDEINIDELPDIFVLKCSHDGGIIICEKYSKEFDFIAVKRELNRRMSINYYWYSRGWCYKNIKPRIICEPYYVDESGVELKDYKFFCFDGKPVMIQVDYNRFSGHKRNLYSLNWELIDGEIEFPADSSHYIERPKILDDMIGMASALSKNIPHVRVDFYVRENSALIGEMTFFHGSGCEHFRPRELGKWLGDFIDITKVRIRDE